MTPQKRHVGALAVRCCIVFCALAPACGKKTDASSDKTGGRGKSRGLHDASFPVEVMRVDLRPHELVVTAPGVVDAFERVQVTARVSGVVDKVTFVEGQEVKRGQALAYVDSRRYALAVSGARAALAKAEATVADTEASLKRRQNASATNPGLIPGEELETYQTRLRTAQADADQAREALKLAQVNLDDSTVKAPTQGVIQTRSVETGQFVQAGTVIATLLQRDPMLLHFSVTTSDAPRLKVGMPVTFTLKESRQAYSAKITLVSGAADSESRLVPVTAEVEATKKYWLRPGSFAEVTINPVSQRQYPMIPQTAARPSDRGFLAYVVEGDVVHERTLALGMHTTDGWVEVKSGLSAGDLLVTRGLEALADGVKVRIVPPSPAGSGSAAGLPPAAPSGVEPAVAGPGSTASAGAVPAALSNATAGPPNGHQRHRADGGRAGSAGRGGGTTP